MTTNQDKTIYVTENKQEFVPSVGDICLAQVYPKSEPEWHECEVLKVNHNDLTAVLVGDTLYWSKNLKPLKTEVDTRREDAINQMIDCVNLGWRLDANIDCMKAHEMTCEQLYDQGYIKPREITEQAIANELGDKVDARYYTAFIHGTRWAEKHIKGEA